MGLAAVSQRTVQGVYDIHGSLTPFMSKIISRGKEEGIREGQLKGRGWRHMPRYWGRAVPAGWGGWLGQSGNTGRGRAKTGKKQGGL